MEDFTLLISSNSDVPALCTVCSPGGGGGGLSLGRSRIAVAGGGVMETERIWGCSLHRGAQTPNQRVGFVFGWGPSVQMGVEHFL